MNRIEQEREIVAVAKPRTKPLLVLAFLAPSAIPLVVFIFVPMISAAWISLQKWNLLSDAEFVSFDNYVSLATDSDTWRIFLNTLYFIIGYLPLVFTGGLVIALALNRMIPGRSFWRGIYFLPVISSWIVVALIWRWLLQPEGGLVNTVIGFFGISGPGWWTDPAWAMPSIIIATAWKDLGFVTIILLAGLQAIDPQINEAAQLDGATHIRKLKRITLPLLTPSIFFVVVISLINGFQVFDQVYAMTGGGPAGASNVVVLEVYDLAFRYGQAGKAAALSWILFIVIAIFTWLQVKGQRRWVFYG